MMMMELAPGEYPMPSHRRGCERHSMPVGIKEQLVANNNNNNNNNGSHPLNRHSLNIDRTPRSLGLSIPESWTQGRSQRSQPRISSLGKSISSIDVAAAANWAKLEMANSSSRPKSAVWSGFSQKTHVHHSQRPKSAAQQIDPTWGNGIKGSRNPHNLTLKLDEIDIKLENALSPHWTTGSRGTKSPTLPPGLFALNSSSPQKWGSNDDLSQPKMSQSSNAVDDPLSSKDPKPMDPVDFETLESEYLASLV